MRFLKKYSFCIPILIIVLASFLRFYKLSEWFFFNIDEDWYSFIVRRIIVYKKPVLIGWEIPGGFYVPPVMYYYGVLIMFLLRSNPLGLALNAAVLSVFGLFLIFFVGRKFFKAKEITLYALIIFGFSYIVNIYSRVTLTIYLGPVLALLTYFSLYKIIKEKKQKWFFVLALVSIFATQEGSLLSLIFLIIVSLIIFRVKLRIKDYLAPLFLSLISFIPLIIFDLRHNSQLINRLISLFSTKILSDTPFNLISTINSLKLIPRVFVRMLIPTGPNDLNVQILPCQNYLKIIDKQTPNFYLLIGFLLILFFIFFPSIKKMEFGKKIITIHLLIVSFGLIIYSFINPGHLYEWFFVVLFPSFAFIAGYFLDYLDKKTKLKFLSIIFILIFTIINLKFVVSGDAAIGYQDKISAVSYAVSQVGEDRFNLEMLGNGCNGYGYRYLFTYLGKEPTKSYMDNQFAGWLYPKNYQEEMPLTVMFVPLVDLDTEDLKSRHEEYKKEAFQSKTFRNLEVLLIRK